MLITIDNCERSKCGVWPLRATPAAFTLYDTRDAPKANHEEVQFFCTILVKLLNIAKRVGPNALLQWHFLPQGSTPMTRTTWGRSSAYSATRPPHETVASCSAKGHHDCLRLYRRFLWGAPSQREVAHRLRHSATRGRGVVRSLLQAKDCDEV